MLYLPPIVTKTEEHVYFCLNTISTDPQMGHAILWQTTKMADDGKTAAELLWHCRYQV